MIKLVVEYTEVIEDSEESDQEGMESNGNNNSSTFTTHALTGYSNHKSVVPVMTLIDTYSTSNFMYIGIAKWLSFLVESCKKFEVTLADGRILHCQNICPKVKL